MTGSYIDPDKPIGESLQGSGKPTIKIKNSGGAGASGYSPGFYSRRDRRNLAKQFGLHKIKETAAQKSERQHRAAEAGQQIHMQHVMDAENSLRNQKSEKEALRIQYLVEKFGEEMAKKMLAEEARIAAKKEAKKNRKRK